MIDYTLILVKNYGDKQWAINANSYESLQWFDNSPKPSQETLDSLWDATKTQITEEEQAQIVAKQSALNKLMALGLTEEEALALGK